MQIDTGTYDPETPWSRSDWRESALAWAEAGLAAHGLEPSGRDTYRVRLRPWSVVVRIPLRGAGDGDVVWFKANPPGSAFEPGLARALASWAPDHVVAPLAVDTARAWSLSPHGGTLLCDDPGRPPHYWDEPLRQYAALQRALLPRTDGLAALGVPDMRPARLPALLDEFLVGPLGRTEADEFAEVRGRFAEWCAELDGGGIPVGLDHADLHEAQVFSRPGRRYAFFDWGDAALAHPFASLLVTVRVTAERLGADGSAAAIARLRDAYLEPWTADGPTLPELRRLASLACRIAPVTRAVTWSRLFPGRHQDAGGDSVAGYAARALRALLDEPPL